jgi:nucleotide-binding universal stress UspA family protein
VRTGRPAATIVEFARESGSDLIVIGAHGRTGAARVIMGSVAEHVVRTAPCPVPVVTPPEKAAAQPRGVQRRT